MNSPKFPKRNDVPGAVKMYFWARENLSREGIIGTTQVLFRLQDDSDELEAAIDAEEKRREETND